MLEKKTKTKKTKTRAVSQNPQASASMLNVVDHDSAIWKRLYKHGLCRRFGRTKPLVSKKNMAAQLKFEKLHGLPSEMVR